MCHYRHRPLIKLEYLKFWYIPLIRDVYIDIDQCKIGIGIEKPTMEMHYICVLCFIHFIYDYFYFIKPY